MYAYYFFLYFCTRVMTAYNPYTSIYHLFLNIKKRDVCHF